MVLVTDVLVLMSAVIGLVAGLALIVISLMQFKKVYVQNCKDFSNEKSDKIGLLTNDNWLI